MIEEARAKFDGYALQDVEGMLQQQELRFRIDRRALDALRIPRVPDLEPAMRGLDVEVSRAADDLAACGLAHDERHRMLVRAHGKRRIDVSRRAFGCRDGRVPQAPKLAVGSRSP